MWHFFWFPVWFHIFFINCRSCGSCIWLLGLLTGRATRVVTLDISKAFHRVWHAGLLHKRKSYGILCQIFGPISSLLSNRQLRVVLDGKSSQEYPVIAGVRRGSILGPSLFLLYINDLPDDVICNIAMLMILLSTLKVIRLLICGNN